MSEIITTALTGDNSDLIKRVSDFYIKDNAMVADVTYGKGVFWKKIDCSRFQLHKTDLENGVDFARLPYLDSSFDILILDPPYMHGGATIKQSINKCYKNMNSSHESVVRLYAGGILEAARVLKVKGQLWIKVQDEIESGKQRLTSHEITKIAELLGFIVKDIFVLVQKTIPAMRVDYQKTARKNHSYLIVFEFRR